MDILTASELVQKPTSELVAKFRWAIIQTRWVDSCLYDLLERQLQWMLGYSLARPREEVLTPNRIGKIEAALEKMRKGEIQQQQGWITIWQTIRFVPTFAIAKMKHELGGCIENI